MPDGEDRDRVASFVAGARGDLRDAGSRARPCRPRCRSAPRRAERAGPRCPATAAPASPRTPPSRRCWRVSFTASPGTADRCARREGDRAIRRFVGCTRREAPPDPSSLARIRQRRGAACSASSSPASCSNAGGPGRSPPRRCMSPPARAGPLSAWTRRSRALPTPWRPPTTPRGRRAAPAGTWNSARPVLTRVAGMCATGSSAAGDATASGAPRRPCCRQRAAVAPVRAGRSTWRRRGRRARSAPVRGPCRHHRRDPRRRPRADHGRCRPWRGRIRAALAHRRIAGSPERRIAGSRPRSRPGARPATRGAPGFPTERFGGAPTRDVAPCPAKTRPAPRNRTRSGRRYRADRRDRARRPLGGALSCPGRRFAARPHRRAPRRHPARSPTRHRPGRRPGRGGARDPNPTPPARRSRARTRLTAPWTGQRRSTRPRGHETRARLTAFAMPLATPARRRVPFPAEPSRTPPSQGTAKPPERGSSTPTGDHSPREPRPRRREPHLRQAGCPRRRATGARRHPRPDAARGAAAGDHALSPGAAPMRDRRRWPRLRFVDGAFADRVARARRRRGRRARAVTPW